MLGKIGGKEEGHYGGWDGWMASPTWWIMSLSKLQQLVMDREAWRSAVHEVSKSWTQLSNWTELNFKIGKELENGASQVALMVKNPLASAGDGGDMSLVTELERSPGGGECQLTPGFPSGKFHGQRSLGATVQTLQVHRRFRHDWAHTHIKEFEKTYCKRDVKLTINIWKALNFINHQKSANSNKTDIAVQEQLKWKALLWNMRVDNMEQLDVHTWPMEIYIRII